MAGEGDFDRNAMTRFKLDTTAYSSSESTTSQA